VGLTELFNEWIVERGSAKVQEKHIALFRDQLALADKRIAELESKVSTLQSKLDNAESQSQQFKKETVNLKQEISRLKNPFHDQPPDETKIKILICLSSQKQHASTDLISKNSGLSHQVVLFHLEELLKRSMVSQILGLGCPTVWILAHEGRRYLLDNNLI
jgi:hypothetical protein